MTVNIKPVYKSKSKIRKFLYPIAATWFMQFFDLFLSLTSLVKNVSEGTAFLTCLYFSVQNSIL